MWLLLFVVLCQDIKGENNSAKVCGCGCYCLLFNVGISKARITMSGFVDVVVIVCCFMSGYQRRE